MAEFDINCVDPLNRSALVAAIENENIELIRLLLEENIKVKDALLHAIKEEYVEAVELLLMWEEDHHEPNTTYVRIKYLINDWCNFIKLQIVLRVGNLWIGHHRHSRQI